MECREFKVRDLRIKEKFFIDDDYVSGWSWFFKASTLAVYVSLCRHADRNQATFPSQDTIAAEHGLSRRTVIKKIKLLQKYNIIRIEKVRTKDGLWLNNTYFLLDKSEWIKPSEKIAHGSSGCKKVQSVAQPLHIKETHTKDTHKEKIGTLVVAEKEYRTLESLTEEEFEQIATKYSVPIAFVRSKYDDLINYCKSKDKRYANYLAALCHFVKVGAIQIRKEVISEDRKRGIDATSIH
jgi:biotin operon repressor